MQLRLWHNVIRCHSRENGNPEPTGNTWIPASAGMTNLKNNNDFDLLTTYNLTPCVQHPHLWVRISLAKGGWGDLEFIF